MYVDPNVGGLLFQILAGVFAALSALVIVFSRHIRQALSRIRRAWRERTHGKEGG